MLQDFSICIQTKFVFGKNAAAQTAREIKLFGAKNVLIHHDDGKFLYDTGLLAEIENQLKAEGIRIAELGGVLPNPRLSLVREGIRDRKSVV